MATAAEFIPADQDHGTGQHVAAGSTEPGKGWAYDAANRGIYIDVDTKHAGFTHTPVYVTSIGGTERHLATTGGCCVYAPTRHSFRVWLRYADGNPISVNEALVGGWHVNWIAVGK
jgi:hypothetical protein